MTRAADAKEEEDKRRMGKRQEVRRRWDEERCWSVMKGNYGLV